MGLFKKDKTHRKWGSDEYVNEYDRRYNEYRERKMELEDEFCERAPLKKAWIYQMVNGKCYCTYVHPEEFNDKVCDSKGSVIKVRILSKKYFMLPYFGRVSISGGEMCYFVDEEDSEYINSYNLVSVRE